MSTARITTLVALSALLGAIGCRTVPIPEPYVIPLPPEMTHQQRVVAILAGILNVHPPVEYDPTTELSDREFDALIRRQFMVTARGRSWFPDAQQGSTIYAAVDTRGLYLRVAIEQEPDSIRISILESRNLSQSETRIHKRAIKWMRNLEAHIRREVGRMSLFIGRPA